MRKRNRINGDNEDTNATSSSAYENSQISASTSEGSATGESFSSQVQMPTESTTTTATSSSSTSTSPTSVTSISTSSKGQPAARITVPMKLVSRPQIDALQYIKKDIYISSVEWYLTDVSRLLDYKDRNAKRAKPVFEFIDSFFTKDNKEHIVAATKCEKSSQDYVKVQNDAKKIIEGIVQKALSDICAREKEKKEIENELTAKSQPLQQASSSKVKVKRVSPDMMRGTITSLEGRLSKVGKDTQKQNQTSNYFKNTLTATSSDLKQTEAMDTSTNNN